MTGRTLGERYFTARERLTSCVGAIESLAAECGLDPTDDEAAAIRDDLTRPLSLVALGEVNAGKSTLLNALAGAELCPAGPLPTTRRTTLYHFCKTAREREDRSTGWLCAGRPEAFLRRIEMIDTPGTNSDARARVFADLDALATADLILVVFPVENTWTAATWDALGALPDEALDRTALVIQRADRKSREDLRVIDGHMRELSLKQVGREFPILPVAAELALASKVRGGDARKGWSASGFSRFEQFVERELCESPPRRHGFDLGCQQAARRLRAIEEALDSQRRRIDDDGWFLAGLENEVEQRRGHEAEMAPRALAGAREAYALEVAAASAFLSARLGWWRSFWGLLFGDATASRVEAKFGELVQRWIDRFGRDEAVRLVEACRQHWSEVRPRIVERLGIEPGDDGLAAEAAIERFLVDLSKATPKIMGQLRIRASLDPPLRQRTIRLKWLTAVALILTTAAGAAGAAGHGDSGWKILLGALLFWLIAAIYSWLNRRMLARSLGDRLWDSITNIEQSMVEDYVEAVSGLFDRYSNCLIVVRRQLARRQADLQPRAKRSDELYVQLKTIEQEIE